ncbi:hypothetical protein CI109_102222 [Kwoniella shandongensis]|uniref:Uncharacterized protein n=1 Tax=Kwoniella shandongensis TaxID=1734106 RepID=A0A5M6C0C8_9TREE|nr:uncharacterized protein CI109_003624 [Kwoniella shandongensis]KAA5527970.1 hypothetical protein CI109_003624 [Kwoniella shandongensis]
MTAFVAPRPVPWYKSRLRFQRHDAKSVDLCSLAKRIEQVSLVASPRNSRYLQFESQGLISCPEPEPEPEPSPEPSRSPSPDRTPSPSFEWDTDSDTDHEDLPTSTRDKIISQVTKESHSVMSRHTSGEDSDHILAKDVVSRDGLNDFSKNNLNHATHLALHFLVPDQSSSPSPPPIPWIIITPSPSPSPSPTPSPTPSPESDSIKSNDKSSYEPYDDQKTSNILVGSAKQTARPRPDTPYPRSPSPSPSPPSSPAPSPSPSPTSSSSSSRTPTPAPTTGGDFEPEVFEHLYFKPKHIFSSWQCPTMIPNLRRMCSVHKATDESWKDRFEIGSPQSESTTVQEWV